MANEARHPDHGMTCTQDVIITAGGSLSSEIDLGGYNFAAIQMPTAWTAGIVSIEAALTSGGTYQKVLLTTGGQLIFTAAAASVCLMLGSMLMPLRFVKVRSGYTTTAVAQTAGATLSFILKK